MSWNDYPDSAVEAAKKVLKWKEEHPDEVHAMTSVGWTRARQLANREKLSLSTIKRMAAFIRHQRHKKLKPEFKSEPWKQNGYVAWLGWGGDSGISWAIRKVKQIEDSKNESMLDSAKEIFTFDTEFNENGKTIDLISIGIVNVSTGEKIHLISSDFKEEDCNDWVKKNVLTKLDHDEPRYTKKAIREKIIEFCGEDPEFWAYYSQYDWVVFCQIFGSMVDLPENYPKFCFDIKQEILRRNIKKDQLPPDPDDEHNALADAEWNVKVLKVLFPETFEKTLGKLDKDDKTVKDKGLVIDLSFVDNPEDEDSEDDEIKFNRMF